MHRFQISVFGSIAIVFAVIGVNQGIFKNRTSLDAMAAGWLILAMIDIIWVLYFTSEEDSLLLHIFNMGGTGGLTPPSRRRRTRTQSSVHNMNMASNNGYATNYSSGGGIGSNDVPYDTKMGSGIGSGALGSGGIGGGMGSAPGIRSQNSFGGGSMGGPGAENRSLGGPASIHSPGGAGSIHGDNNGPNSPLMAGVGSGNSPPGGSGSPGGAEPNSAPQPETYLYKAKALYSCEFCARLHASII